jgi:hypothetical protein
MNERAALGQRGQAIWDAYDATGLAAGHRALVHEAARLADTLDKLQLLAAGDIEVWASLVTNDGTEFTLEVNGVLAEIRNQQSVFKNVMLEIRQTGLKQTGPAKSKDETTNVDDGDTILSFQRAVERRAAG